MRLISGFLAVLAVVLAGAGQAHAGGPSVYFDLEGFAGADHAPRIGMLTYVPVESPTPDPFVWNNGLERPFMAGGRVEAGVKVALPDVSLKAGLALDAWGGETRFSGEVLGGVIMTPNATGYIQLCVTAPCPMATMRVSRGYAEIMPVLAAEWQAGDGATLGLGASPFYGHFVEDSFSRLTQTVTDLASETDLDANLYGGLLTASGSIGMGEGLSLTLGGGLGAYSGFASGVSRTVIGSSAGPVTDTAAFDGWRGQVSAELSRALADHVSIGLIGRLDLWSALPQISQDYDFVDGCDLSLCSPPRVTGDYLVGTHPEIQSFVGLNLRYEN